MKNDRKVNETEKVIDIYMYKIYDEIISKTFLNRGRAQYGCFY